MDEPNFELIAIILGNELKYLTSINEIERVARATLKVRRLGFSHENITSQRANLIYDWIMSLAKSNLPLKEKRNRILSFIEYFNLEKSVKDKILNKLGIESNRKININSAVIGKFNIEPILAEILKKRLDEIDKCMNSKAYLSAIIMMGSLLEGLLLSVISANPKEANLSKSAPKKSDGKVKKFHEWKLQDFISVANECGWIEVDVKDFSILLRDYRNLVHPYHQLQKGIYPDKDTAKICLEVLNAVINDLIKNKV